MNTYRVEMYVTGTDDDAISLRKSLAQSVRDEFELGSVFGVNVTRDIPYEDDMDRVMSLCMVALEDGIDGSQICNLMASLLQGRKYMPIEFHENNSSAYGYIDAEYYEIHGYDPSYFAVQIQGILGDMNLESADGRYLTPDGRQFYMGYFND